MNNDIRAPYETPQLPPLETDNLEDSLPSPEDVTDPKEQVNERKIEEEFGPPPNELPYEETKPTKKLSKFSKKPSKKGVTFIIVAVLVVLAACGASYFILHKYNPKALVFGLSPKKVATTVPSTLTGLMVDPSVNQRPVTAVMIENSLDARPQSGLDQAGVVFEALAEGGITRFMALFQDTQPNYIGPVRSARPYYVQWALGFDAGYAHVGGSPDALQDIKTWNVRDLDQFYNSSAYERVSSRYAPHNVYTSIASLNQLEATKGYSSSSFTGFARKKEAPSKTPTVTSIDMAFSGADYNTHYDYDTVTNSYKRSEGGAPHMELNKDGTQVQITPKVVIAMIVPESAGALDSSGARYSDYAAIGSGTVYVFQDGTVQTGKWTKSSNTSQIQFTDANGQPLRLNPGQTWISALAGTTDITYK